MIKHILLLLVLVSVSSSTNLLAPKPQDVGCVRTSTGTDYLGSQNVSSSGRPCVRWDSLVGAFRDHIKMLFLTMPERSALKAQNYCRNPNSDQRGLWCFVSQLGTVQFCSVPKCATFGTTTASPLPMTQHKMTRPPRSRNMLSTTPDLTNGADSWSQARHDPEYNEITANRVDRYDVSERDMQNDEAPDDAFNDVNQLYGDSADPYETSSLMEQRSSHGDDESNEAWPADRQSIVSAGDPIPPISFPDSAASLALPSTISFITLSSLILLFAL